jgi:hypothetical protein
MNHLCHLKNSHATLEVESLVLTLKQKWKYVKHYLL